MENYGFVLLTDPEANNIGFPRSIGSFQEYCQDETRYQR